MINANEAAKLTQHYRENIKAKAEALLPAVVEEVDSLIALLACNGEGETLYDLQDYTRKTNADINVDVAKEITNQLADILCASGFRVSRETYCSLYIGWYKMN